MKSSSRSIINTWCRFALSLCVAGLASATIARAQDPDQITAADVKGSRLRFTHLKPRTSGNTGADQATLPPVSVFDSIVNFSGEFSAPGIGPSGQPQNTWVFNTIGNPPKAGGTTTVNGPIVPVSLDLRNADGSPRYVRVVNRKAITCGTSTEPGCKRLFFSADPFIQPVLESPVFSNSNYTSSDVPTQFADAVSRAEYQGAKSDWHTLLAPSVKTARTIVINQDQTCGIGRGKGGHCNYLYAVNSDGSCCFFVLLDANPFANKLFPGPTSTFPPATDTPIGAAEAAKEITTKDLSTFFFPPAYLYVGSPNVCCIGGFHTIDVEPGDSTNGNKPRAFVVNYSTWDQPIFVDPEVLDVTGLSHEITEAYNDPFVTFDNIHDITPWWLSANGQCQNALETGDVIEGLPHEIFPIIMPNGFTYHPQNEALLQWFEFQSPSTALNGAYSYPDITSLTTLSAPQKPGCAP
jgi:hypothetical protein